MEEKKKKQELKEEKTRLIAEFLDESKSKFYSYGSRLQSERDFFRGIPLFPETILSAEQVLKMKLERISIPGENVQGISLFRREEKIFSPNGGLSEHFFSYHVEYGFIPEEVGIHYGFELHSPGVDVNYSEETLWRSKPVDITWLKKQGLVAVVNLTCHSSDGREIYLGVPVREKK